MVDDAIVFDDDNPEWTDADVARARPGAEVLPPGLVAALIRDQPVARKGAGGRPRGSNKEQVTLRLDRDVVERFRAGGAGWQTRINEALRRAVQGPLT